MTELAKRKTKLRFVTAAEIRGRKVVIEAEPYLLRVREQGRRYSYELSWEAVYWLAVKKAVQK